MKKADINVIAAIHKPTLAIGLDGEIPWDHPKDMEIFRNKTMGNPVLMGRKTWDSLPVHPLPGRHNIVLTTSKEFADKWASPDVSVCSSLDVALRETHAADELWVMGGAAVYEQMLPLTDSLHISWIEEPEELGEADKVTTFPKLTLYRHVFERQSREEYDGFFHEVYSR
jgi:dihydrofolate reductase